MSESTSNSENNEALLQELALRLLIQPFESRPQNPQLLVGRLPENLPVEIPQPEGSRLLGSLMRNPEIVDVVLDVPSLQNVLSASIKSVYRRQDGMSLILWDCDRVVLHIRDFLEVAHTSYSVRAIAARH